MPTLSQNATHASSSSTIQSLRDEARLLALAGVILLAIGFPLTLTLVAFAMAPHGLSPIVPLVAGGPPILLGYVACHFASKRLARARSLHGL